MDKIAFVQYYYDSSQSKYISYVGIVEPSTQSYLWLLKLEPITFTASGSDTITQQYQILTTILIDEDNSRVLVFGYLSITYQDTTTYATSQSISSMFLAYDYNDGTQLISQLSTYDYIYFYNTGFLDSTASFYSTNYYSFFKFSTLSSFQVDYKMTLTSSSTTTYSYLSNLIFGSSENEIFLVARIDNYDAALVQVLISNNVPTVNQVVKITDYQTFTTSGTTYTISYIYFDQLSYYSNTVVIYGTNYDYSTYTYEYIYCLLTRASTSSSFTTSDVKCYSATIFSNCDVQGLYARQMSTTSSMISINTQDYDYGIFKAYFGTLNLSTNQMTLKELDLFYTDTYSNYGTVQGGIIGSNGVAYFTQDLLVDMKYSDTSLTYYKSALFTSEYTDYCFAYTIPSQTYDFTLQTSYAKSVITSFSDYTVNYTTWSITDQSYYTETQITGNAPEYDFCFAGATNVYLNQVTQYSDITYYIGAGTMTYNLDLFEIVDQDALTCDDATITYSLLVYIDNVLQSSTPSEITFSTTTTYLKVSIIYSTMPTFTLSLAVRATVDDTYTPTTYSTDSNTFYVTFSEYDLNCQSITLDSCNTCSTTLYSTITLPSETFTITEFTYTGASDCSIVYELDTTTGDTQSLVDDGIITFDTSSLELTLYSQDDSQANTYTFRLQGYEATTQSTSLTYCDYTLIVFPSPCASSTALDYSNELQDEYIYNLADGEVVMDKVQWEILYSQCGSSVIYYLDDISGTLIADSIVTIDSYDQLIVNANSDTSYLGTFTVQLTAYPFQYSVTFDITISNTLSTQVYTIPETPNTPPYFDEGLSTQQFVAGELTSYDLPNVVDDQGDLYTANADLGTAKNFITFSKSQLKFIINSQTSDAGTYQIKVTLTDKNTKPLSSQFWFSIILTAPSTQDGGTDDNTNSNTDTNSTSSSNSTNSTSDSSVGQDYLDFLMSGGKITPGKLSVRDKSQMSFSLTAKITKVSESGVMTIKFNKEIIPINNISLINESVLKIRIKSSSTGIISDAKWEIVDYTSTQLVIQLYFDDPLQVSQGVKLQLLLNLNLQSKDKITIFFVQNGYFKELSSQLAIQYLYSLSGYIPKQLAQDGNLISFLIILNIAASAAIAGSKQSIGSSLKVLTFGNFLINLLLQIYFQIIPSTIFRSSSLQFLWGMINAQQLIVHLPLLSVNFPENAKMLFQSIYELTSFQIIPTETMVQNIYQFKNDQSFNSEYESFDIFQPKKRNQLYTQLILRYKSKFLVQNLGSIYVYMNIIIIMILLLGLLSLVSLKYQKQYHDLLIYFRLKGIRDRISKMIIFNMIIRFFLESYIEFGICSFINIMLYDWNNFGGVISTLFSILISILCISSPILFFLIIRKNLSNISDEKFKERFGSLYENTREDKIPSLMINVIFVFRRLLFCLSCVFLQGSFFTQLIIQYTQSFMMFFYLLRYKPFIDDIFNKLEIFNEACILIINYHLTLFTDFNEDEKMQYTAGWSIMLFTLINILVNMGIVLSVTIKKLKVTYKQLVQKFRNRKAMKYSLFSSTPIQLNFLGSDIYNQQNQTLKIEQMVVEDFTEDIKLFELQENPNQKSNIQNKRKKSGSKKVRNLSSIFRQQQIPMELNGLQNTIQNAQRDLMSENSNTIQTQGEETNRHHNLVRNIHDLPQDIKIIQQQVRFLSAFVEQNSENNDNLFNQNEEINNNIDQWRSQQKHRIHFFKQQSQ